ncbi:MAG: hypothetical protein PHE09_20665 [Oscillospiraceae bacterium]|nr:hypothetical protein [Oscillospiraceae bacterium]
MEATMTMPVTGFTDLETFEEMNIEGGVKWHQYAAGLVTEIGGGIVGLVAPEVGIPMVFGGMGMAESALD